MILILNLKINQGLDMESSIDELQSIVFNNNNVVKSFQKKSSQELVNKSKNSYDNIIALVEKKESYCGFKC